MVLKFRKISKNFCLFFALCGIFVYVLLVVSKVGATEMPSWLTATTFQFSKTSDLPQNQEPSSRGYECNLRKDVSGTLRCWYATPLGQYSNGQITRADGTFNLEMSDGSLLLPSPSNQPNTIVSQYYDKSKSQWQIKFTTFDPTKLAKVARWNISTYYVYTYKVESATILKDPNGQPLSIEPSGIAYSENGRWLAVQTRGSSDGVVGGIIIYDLENILIFGKMISVPSGMKYYPWSDIKSSNLAVSNDGKFVAYNSYIDNLPAKPSLRIYDVTTCINQYSYLAGGYGNNCEYSDIWNGVFRSNTFNSNLPSSSGVEYPRHLRFNPDNSLSFQGVYSRTSSTQFSVGEYKVETSDNGKPPLSLLVMGDSYISGEGAYYYRSGTNTKDNKCHNSWLAYGYQKGWSHFPSDGVKSVACSGARLNDIDAGLWASNPTISREDYEGQVKVKIPWSDRDDPQSKIIGNYMPGYANQILFLEKNYPRNILMSVGGNDIGFSDIIKACALSSFEDDCYSTYQQRKELMEKINSQYYGLKKTYENIKSSTMGGKVYVVGYPQVAKLGGNCGLNVHLNYNEVEFSNNVISYLNETIKRAASDAGVLYVNVENALFGYRLCEATKNNAAVNGLTKGGVKKFSPLRLLPAGEPITYLVEGGVANESYHPTSFGHKLLGAEIVKQTRNFTVSMPKSTSLKANTFNFTDPMINKFIPGDDEIFNVLWNESNDNSVPILTKNAKYKINVPAGLDSSGTVRIVQFSEPKVLYDGPANQAEISVSSDSATGSHIFSIFGKDTNGDNIVYKQAFYVANSTNDVDGDGLPDDLDGCELLPQSNIDEDGDGIDDACDGEINDSGILPDGVSSIPEETSQLEESDTTNIANQSLLSPIVYSPEPPKEEGSTDQTSQDENTHSSGSTDENSPNINGNPSSNSGNQEAPISLNQSKQTVNILLHTTTNPVGAMNLTEQEAQSSLGNVLGSRQVSLVDDHSKPKMNRSNTKDTPKQGRWRIAGVIVVGVISSLVLARKLYNH